MLFTQLYGRVYYPAIMPQWTSQSYVADVLSLGPRTAGRLMQVGVRTVDDLFAANPQSVAQRLAEERFGAEIIEQWQREARLVLTTPDLPQNATRLLASMGYSSREKIARSTPTELLGAFETASQEGRIGGGLEKNSPPSISELTKWIHCAQPSSKDLAA